MLSVPAQDNANSASLSKTYSTFSGSNLLQYSFPSCTLGAASNNRIVVIGVALEVGVVNVTINGTEANLIRSANTSGEVNTAFTSRACLAWLPVPSGTICNVVYNCITTGGRAGIEVYNVYPKSLTPANVAVTTRANTHVFRAPRNSVTMIASGQPVTTPVPNTVWDASETYTKYSSAYSGANYWINDYSSNAAVKSGVVTWTNYAGAPNNTTETVSVTFR